MQRALARERKQQHPRYEEMSRRFLVDTEDFSLENINKRNIQNICDNNGSLDETMKNVYKILEKHL